MPAGGCPHEDVTYAINFAPRRPFRNGSRRCSDDAAAGELDDAANAAPNRNAQTEEVPAKTERLQKEKQEEKPDSGDAHAGSAAALDACDDAWGRTTGVATRLAAVLQALS